MSNRARLGPGRAASGPDGLRAGAGRLGGGRERVRSAAAGVAACESVTHPSHAGNLGLIPERVPQVTMRGAHRRGSACRFMGGEKVGEVINAWCTRMDHSKRVEGQSPESVNMEDRVISN